MLFCAAEAHRRDGISFALDIAVCYGLRLLIRSIRATTRGSAPLFCTIRRRRKAKRAICNDTTGKSGVVLIDTKLLKRLSSYMVGLTCLLSFFVEDHPKRTADTSVLNSLFTGNQPAALKHDSV